MSESIRPSLWEEPSNAHGRNLAGAIIQLVNDNVGEVYQFFGQGKSDEAYAAIRHRDGQILNLCVTSLRHLEAILAETRKAYCDLLAIIPPRAIVHGERPQTTDAQPNSDVANEKKES